jgi:deoxyribose-phosphate aldolase
MDIEFNNLVESISNEVIAQLKDKKFFISDNYGKIEDGENPISKIAKMIDHTLLKPDATYEQIKQLCDEAIEYGFASVCVNSGYVTLAVEYLKNSAIPVCCTIGFPLGATTTKTKVFEAREAIENGAKEIDMVINIGALKSKDYNKVRTDIEEVVLAAKGKAAVKVIIETCLLTNDEKVIACEISKTAGANFVKTSTGFSSGGATVDDIKLMRKAVGPKIGIKASGGISSYEGTIALLEAGACTIGDNNLCRIGTSKSINIIEESK